jgi:predicted HAD superfamily hydrolase
MIRELGLQLKIDELYFIRKESEIHLSNVLQKLTLEVAYKQVINEVYNRLLCTNNLSGISLHVFSEYFELADYYSEIKVQYLNSIAIESLKTLKDNGCEIYCLSDFYMSSAVLKKVMDYHSIKHIVTNQSIV